MSEGAPLILPKFDYHLDESDPARRARAASPGRLLRCRIQRRGATREGILEATKEDHAALLREHAGTLEPEDEAHRSRSA